MQFEWIPDSRGIVEACTHDGSHARYEDFWIHIPTGGPLLIEVARAAGLPDDFEHSWNGYMSFIYPQPENMVRRRSKQDKGADKSQGECDESPGSEDEDEAYETADEGEESFEL